MAFSFSNLIVDFFSPCLSRSQDWNHLFAAPMHELILNKVNVCECSKAFLKDARVSYKREVGKNTDYERLLIVSVWLYQSICCFESWLELCYVTGFLPYLFRFFLLCVKSLGPSFIFRISSRSKFWKYKTFYFPTLMFLREYLKYSKKQKVLKTLFCYKSLSANWNNQNSFKKG